MRAPLKYSRVHLVFRYFYILGVTLYIHYNIMVRKSALVASTTKARTSGLVASTSKARTSGLVARTCVAVVGTRARLLVIGLLIGLSQVVAQKPLYTWPLGVEGYTYRNSWPRGVAQTLDTIRMLGFTELEGGARMEPHAFRRLCDERGISIPSIGADYDQLVKHPDSVILLAKILGAKYVMCAWIPHSGGVLTIDNAKKAVADFNRAGKVLAESGASLLLSCAWV